MAARCRNFGNKSFYGFGVKNFLTGGQFAKACVVLLVATLIAPGCSNIALPAEGAPPMGPDPGYAALVADFMQKSFKDVPPSSAAEISEPRWVQSERGWNWLACVHFQDHSGRRRTYSVFFNQGKVVDARYAVLTDACGAQSYMPLDLAGSTRGPRSLGDNGPLY
jgi:hypothetical protein